MRWLGCRPVALRALYVVLALVCIGVGAHALRADHRCAQAKADARTAPAGALAGVADEIADRCGDPRDEIVGAVLIGGRGQRALATSLARRIAAQHPDDYLGWLAIYRIGGDQRALARAHALNPRAVPLPARPR
jgi:hypothetical protein